jgi:hypothetical protein
MHLNMYLTVNLWSLHICCLQKIRAVQTLAVIRESVSWMDTGDTNVNVSVVTTGVDVKVSLVFRLWNWTIYKSTFIWINNSFIDINKKSLKIPKRQSESVNRKTDNPMAKRKRTNNDLQNIHIKLKDRETRTPHKKPGVNSSAPEW